MLGAGVYLALKVMHQAEPWPILIGMLTTLSLRLAAIRWNWALPVFEPQRPPRN